MYASFFIYPFLKWRQHRTLLKKKKPHQHDSRCRVYIPLHIWSFHLPDLNEDDDSIVMLYDQKDDPFMISAVIKVTLHVCIFYYLICCCCYCLFISPITYIIPLHVCLSGQRNEKHKDHPIYCIVLYLSFSGGPEFDISNADPCLKWRAMKISTFQRPSPLLFFFILIRYIRRRKETCILE